MTTLGTTEDHVAADEGTPTDVTYAAGIDAVARLHDDALQLIAHLAEAWAAPAPAAADDVRVLRIAERPTVTQRVDVAA